MRVVEIDLLRQHALAFNLGNFRSTLNRPCDQIGEVVEFAIGIAVSGNRGEFRGRLLWITNKNALPGVRMNFSPVKSFLGDAISGCADFFIGSIGEAIGSDEAVSAKGVAFGDDLLLFDEIHERLRICLEPGRHLPIAGTDTPR